MAGLSGVEASLWGAPFVGGLAGIALRTRLNPQTPHRQEFWHVQGGWAVYPLLGALVALLLTVPYRRLRLYRLGRRDARCDHVGLRLKQAITQALSTHRVVLDHDAGVYHTRSYSSIVALTIVTTLLAVDNEVVTPLTGGPFLRGPMYLGYKLFGDSVGVIGLVGLGMAGGMIWLEEHKGRRVNQARAQETIATGADVVAVACPFCIQMFEDAIPAVQPDESKRIKAADIAELAEIVVLNRA